MIYQTLIVQKQDLEAKLAKVTKAIQAMQDVCEHKDELGRDTFQWKGNHAQYNIYQCTLCGIENKV
jgi:hypothetical protein